MEIGVSVLGTGAAVFSDMGETLQDFSLEHNRVENILKSLVWEQLLIAVITA